MSETLQPPRITFPDDAALDAAAETLTGLTLLNAAYLAWASLTALAEGERSDTVVHHRAIVLLALQVKPLRDWLLVQAIDHEDLSLACTRELVWLVAKAPQPLQAAAAGATAMLLIAITGSAPAARYHADLGGSDTLAQLVGPIVESQLPGIERSRTLQWKREADAFRVDLDSAIQKATYVDPRGGRVGLSEYAAAWLDSRHTAHRRFPSERDRDRTRAGMGGPARSDPVSGFSPQRVRGAGSDPCLRGEQETDFQVAHRQARRR